MQLRGVGALIRRVSLAKARSPFETLRSGRERARGESWRLSRCLRNYASLPERVASELPGEPLADPLRVGDSGSNAPPTLEFVAPADASPFSTFALLDASGVPLPGARPEEVMDEATALNILRTILDLQAADSVFYDAQRQGRIAFFMTSTGEEACTVAAGAALSPADRVLSQYREMGVLLARGFGLGAVADQLAGNARDVNHARQMPMHLGSRAHNFVTVSSPLATQMPHAVGHALAIKLSGEDAIAACFFGEGAASEGDAHAAFNFAAVLGAPVLFLCRNNGWAISTPSSQQYKGDGVAAHGPAHGIPAARVDGGDAVAVYAAVREARERVARTGAPLLLEFVTDRAGHHSTSDDASRYRDRGALAASRTRDPAARFERWLEARGLWDRERGAAGRADARARAVAALEDAERQPPPPLEDAFEGVYDALTPELRRQLAEARDAVRAHPELLPAARG